MNSKESRREFLAKLIQSAGLAVSASLVPFSSAAYPIDRLLGSGDNAFASNYLKRMWDWYAQEFEAPFSRLSVMEKDYILTCISKMPKWTVNLEGYHAFEHCLFSHRISNGQVSHGRISIGLPATELKSLDGLIRDICQKRGAKLPDGQLFGLGWDVDKEEFKTYEFHEGASTVKDPEILRLMKLTDERDLLPQRMTGTTFKNGKAIERKIILAYRKTPDIQEIDPVFKSASIATMRVLRDSGRSDWFFRTSIFHLNAIAPAGKKVGLVHSKEFAQITDAILWQDRSNCCLYYP